MKLERETHVFNFMCETERGHRHSRVSPWAARARISKYRCIHYSLANLPSAVRPREQAFRSSLRVRTAVLRLLSLFLCDVALFFFLSRKRIKPKAKRSEREGERIEFESEALERRS